MLELKQKYGTVAIANLAATARKSMWRARYAERQRVDIVELNISCPNVKVGGMAYGVKAKLPVRWCGWCARPAKSP